MISLKEVLRLMHTGAPFSVKVVRYDRRRRERNGRVEDFPECVLVWGDGGSDRTGPKGERGLTELEKKLCGMGDEDKRDPNHGHYFTRNVRLLLDGNPTSERRKIRPSLIIEFNGEKTMA